MPRLRVGAQPATCPWKRPNEVNVPPTVKSPGLPITRAHPACRTLPHDTGGTLDDRLQWTRLLPTFPRVPSDAVPPPSESAPGFGDAILAALVDAAVDGIIAIDVEGTVASFNAAASRLFGYTAEEVVGQNVKMLMPPQFADHHDGYLHNYVATGERKIIGSGRDVLGQRKDGSQFPMHLSVAEARVGQGRYFLGIARDLTDVKEAERAKAALIRELESKNAELERFTYTVSHDLKSPLITIKGFLMMMQEDIEAQDHERLQSDMMRVANAADKMKQLLDELLELSRIGRVVNPPETVSLTALSEEVRELLRGPLKQSGVSLEIQADMPSVRGDRLRLREVLQNLIENSIKFTRADGDEPSVWVSATQEEGTVRCAVRDNGMGIEPHYVEKVFGLFEQLDPSRMGSGVGLALVQRIVEVHGGRVWAQSEGLGHGASFCFELPVEGTNR